MLGGLKMESDIDGPYPVEKLQNMGAYTLSNLRQITNDSFSHFTEIKDAMRRHRTLILSTERELNEVGDLMAAWQALSECQSKTVGHLNAIKQSTQKKFRELVAQKEPILDQFKQGIADLKKYELHQSLWKNPSQKQHLIDIYYNESSMNSFKNSCVI